MMLLDYFGLLVGFMEKGTKLAKCGIGIPRSSVSPRHGTADREAWTSLEYAKA